MSNKLLKKRYNGHCLYRVIPDPRYLTLLTNGYGTLLADALSGYSGSVVHLTATPDDDCHFIDYDSTACEIVGDDLIFSTSDCTAQANFGRNVHNVTTLTSNYGSISVNKNTGYSGDIFTLSNTPNADCTFGSYSVTGATLTSNQFMMQKEDISARGSFNRNVHNVTLQNDGHGSIGANKTTGYSGDTITLSNTANAGYSFSGYSITGATLTSNQFKLGTGNVTAKAWFSANKSAVYYNGSLRLNNLGNTNWSQSGALNVNRNTAFRYTTFLCTNSFYNDVLISISSNNTLWQLCQPNGSESLTANYRATKFGLRNNSAGQLVGTSTNAYNTTCSNSKGSYCRVTLYKMSPSIAAKYKLVIDNDVKSASAYWNNNYVGYQSADMTAIKSICAESVENYGNKRWWDISAIRIAGFKDFTAATAYNG